MRRADLKEKQIKRILYYWNALYNDYKLNSDPALEFMSEVFCLSERYMYVEIVTKYDLKDYEEIKLKYLDLDEMVISGFIDKMNKETKRERKEQLQMALFDG